MPDFSSEVAPTDQASRKKRMVLVFPPLTMPTSPPLGVSMLKAFVERQLPDWEIVVLDLNLWCFQQLFSRIGSGALKLNPQAMQAMGIREAGILLQAARAFNGGDPGAFYANPKLYDHMANAFLGFINVMVGAYAQQCSMWEKDQKPLPMLQELIDRIAAEKPDCLGISMIFDEQLPIGAMFGRYFRTRHNIKVFFGGSCFTEGVPHFLKWYPQAADAIVSGDGEMALTRLLANGGDPTEVPGASFLRDGEVVTNPPQYDENIDSFGRPDFSWADLHAYYSPEPVVPLLLSRGCYWRKCTFCVHYFSAGDTYRMHSLDHVVAMLREFSDQGITNFSFVDEMIAPGHFVQLSRAIEEAQLEIAYYALSKPNKTFTPKVLAAMARSGCKYLLWGVESGCQRVVNLMGKGTKVEDIADVLANAHAAGIANHIYIISGFPTETDAEFAETIRFLDANKANISAIHRSVFGLELGSPIMRAPEKFGIEKVWMKQKTPLGGRLGYNCTSGVTAEQALKNFQKALPFWKSFSPYAQYLPNFRDHALLVYKKIGEQLDMQQRSFPDVTEFLAMAQRTSEAVADEVG